MDNIIVRILRDKEILDMWNRGNTDIEILRYFKLLGMVMLEDGVERELTVTDIRNILHKQS